MTDLDALRSRWLKTLLAAREGACHPDPYHYADNLLRRRSEPQRRYHTVDHLSAVLDHVDVLEGHAADPEAVPLAAWFHDAVYLPPCPRGE